MTHADVMPLLLVGMLTALASVLVKSRISAWEFQVFVISAVLHLLAAYAQVWLVMEVYHTGDLLLYRDFGLGVSGALSRDFWSAFPELLRVMILGENRLGLFLIGEGSATGNMIVLTGIMQFFLNNSLYAVSIAFSMAACFGKLACYQAFKESLPQNLWFPVSCALMLLPSAIFWSSGVIKEGVAVTGLGLLLLACSRYIQRRRSHPVLLVMGAALVALVKPYILFAFCIALGAWYYWQRAARSGGVQVRPLYLGLAVLSGVFLLTMLGWMFPEYSVNSIIDETAEMQQAGARRRGGSSITLGDPMARSLQGQLAFVPLALMTALYRPMLFEVSNAQMLLNAFETTTVLILSVVLVWMRSPADVWRALNREPILVFCVVFAGVMALAVGLTASNLGTLSRYRMPLYPFFAVVLLVLVAQTRSRSHRASDASRIATGQPEFVPGSSRATFQTETQALRAPQE